MRCTAMLFMLYCISVHPFAMRHLDVKPASIISLASCSFHATDMKANAHMHVDLLLQKEHLLGIPQSTLRIHSDSVPYFA